MKNHAKKYKMKNKALVVIDLQNDITKNYREIIDTVNQAIDRAVSNNMEVVYIQHNNLSAGTRTFKPGICYSDHLALKYYFISKKNK